jgi:hypothetical protein
MEQHKRVCWCILLQKRISLSLCQKPALVYFIFSNVKQFSGAVAGGGTTASELQTSTVFKSKYMFRNPFPRRV